MAVRVLVADDSLTVRMALVDTLADAGFEVVAADSVAAARAAIAGDGFDLLLLDVIFPDGDGVALLEEVRADPRHRKTPVMLLSGEDDVSDRVRGLSRGADEYLGKPFDPAVVVARARQLTGAVFASTAPEGARRVLLIDDSPTWLTALRDAFEAAGFAPITAPDGEAGLRLAADLRPEAIVVDGHLPGIDGAEVIRRVRFDAALRRTPCLLLTAAGTRADELRAFEAGADAFVSKDNDVDVVLARVNALLRAQGAGDAAAPEAITPSALAPKRVLAVDDSLTYRELVGQWLREDGYEVVLAASGAEALELLAVQPVDCVLLDVMMPGLSGPETCAAIRASPALRDIPVIMLTGREDRASMIEGMNAGADDYVAKSADNDVIAARLRAQIRRKQFEDESRLIREQLQRKELEAAEARAAVALADTRARLLADLEVTNEELAAANAELARAKERAERESRFKSRFLANMSHELRTPLNAILGFGELLELGSDGALNPTQQEYVGYVLTSARHLTSLVQDILDLSKIEAGKVDLNPVTVSLADAVKNVRGVLQGHIYKQGVRVDVDVAPDAAAVHADPVRLRQVLYNLLSNAIKFTDRGGRVRLETRRAGAFVAISVADTGIGIRPEDLPRLFQEFERIKPVDGPEREGTGLGLALTKRLVELHGGTITVASEPGVGTTFIARLPADEASFPESPPS
ncbi:MAG: response regulator [Deltaproteobacteria bacterium]|nr:response regulator [Deltaproteobacteria bacterium]